jgi:hypothetical protein
MCKLIGLQVVPGEFQQSIVLDEKRPNPSARYSACIHVRVRMMYMHSFFTASADLFERQLEERRDILSTESRLRVCPHAPSDSQVIRARGNEKVF